MRQIAGTAIALLLIAGLVVTVGPEAAAATTRYVDVEDVACSDITGTPFCSIQAAVDVAIGGDTIQVAAGTYTGTGTNVVQILKDLTIIGADRDTVIIEGEFARRAVSVSGGATVTVRDLTIQNGDIVGSGAGVQVVDPGTSLSMLFVRITGNSASGPR